MKRNRHTYGTPLFSPPLRVSSFDLDPDPRSHMGKRGSEDPQRSLSPRSLEALGGHMKVKVILEAPFFDDGLLPRGGFCFI